MTDENLMDALPLSPSEVNRMFFLASLAKLTREQEAELLALERRERARQGQDRA